MFLNFSLVKNIAYFSQDKRRKDILHTNIKSTFQRLFMSDRIKVIQILARKY